MPSIDSAGVRLEYAIHDETGGRGEPLLCIMGLGVGSSYWFAQVEELRHRFRVITFDNRGSGESERPPGPYTMARFAEDAMNVLDAAGHETAHVMGVSMGGMIAQHVALTYPERVERLVLLATHAGGTTAHQPSAEVIQGMATRLNSMDASMDSALEQLGWIIFPEDYLAEEKAALARLLEAHAPKPAGPEAFQAQVMAILGHDTCERLAEIRKPTLVVTGDRDILVPPGNSEILAKEIPGAQLVTLTGAGHGVNIQSAKDLNRVVSDFLDPAAGI